MTERQWLAWTEPTAMLEWAGGKATERQLRLFAVACCRGVWEWLPDERCRDGLFVAEAYAEGKASHEKLSEEKWHAWNVGFTFIDVWPRPNNPISYVACNALQNALFDGKDYTGNEPDLSHESIRDAAGKAAEFAANVFAEGHSRSPSGDSAWNAARISERARQSIYLRDILGNPFRPLSAPSPSLLAWSGGLVVNLAQAAYQHRSLPPGHLDNARLAVLADALTDAGCTDDRLLGHLRSPGPHARGCVGVDAVLGKS
jgi:hypothetical protein